MQERNRPPTSEPTELTQFKKDTLSAFSIWVVLEVFSFLLLPSFQLVNEDKTVNWLLWSVPLGLGGSVLVGISSECMAQCQDKLRFHPKRQMLSFAAQMGNWLGLGGIGFPLVVAILELWYSFSSFNPASS